MFDFKAALMSQVNNGATEPDIREQAETLRGTPLLDHIGEQEFQYTVESAIQSIRVSYQKSYVVESDEKHTPWFQQYYKDLGVTRWDRYIDYLQNQKHFEPKVVAGMQESLFKITDLLGDPNGHNFIRKGLVVGDVQSGKTANYVGLMNLAADTKYKLIIVLTGTTNTLREQTQIRIEEGLGIANLDKGVGIINNVDYNTFANKHPVYLTTRQNDFRKIIGENVQQSIESTNVPIIIVTKKNATSLKNIYSWLDGNSRIQNHDHIDSSLLLIDDEADFASVDVSKEDAEQPTAINSKIRQILKLFTKSSYIGFTATPYANIFINPENDIEMYGQDLFPRDYIYVLGESDEYIGVQSVFNEEAEHKKMLIEIQSDEVETYLPLKHKSNHNFSTLAPSMIDAINLFFLANTIRDDRGDTNAHRSMLMNISRLKDIHVKVKDVVLDYITRVKKDIRIYSKLPLEEALEVPTIDSIRKTFDIHYTDLAENYQFDDLLKKMNDSIYRIEVKIVNSENKELDYLLNEKEGERVIVIGGFSLSRGLTLEGLMISYYYRNSVMYDSLLQMGRWFGYRPNYSDLCRIYMTKNVISDFQFIAMATKELKEDLEINSKRGLTPREFGIRVRSGQTGLIITARNKMQYGEKLTARVNFSKDIIETTAINVDDRVVNKKNTDIIKNLIDKHEEKVANSFDPNGRSQIYGLRDVDKVQIIQFLKDYAPAPGSKFDSDLIIKWLNENNAESLNQWDVIFPTGSGEDDDFDYGHGVRGKVSLRTVLEFKKQKGVYKNSNSRLGSPTDGRYGLSKEKWKKVKDKYNEGTISQKKYLEAEFCHKPTILVYSVTPRNEKGEKLSENYIPMISVEIPELDREKSSYVRYVVNTVYKDLEDVEVSEG